MSKPDTSAEAQGRLVHERDGVRSTLGMLPYEPVYTAATLRVLLAAAGATIAARNEAIRQLKAERDALMEALKAYDDAMTACWGAPEYLPDGNPDAARCWPMARAAIAKATGGDQ